MTSKFTDALKSDLPEVFIKKTSLADSNVDTNVDNKVDSAKASSSVMTNKGLYESKLENGGTGDSNFVLPTAETIMSYIKTEKPADNPDELRKALSGMVKFIESSDLTVLSNRGLAGSFFVYLKYVCLNYKPLANNAAFMMFVKAIFHKYIHTLGFHELIPLYDSIFNDAYYANIKNLDTSLVFIPVLTEEWKQTQLKDYTDSIKQINYRLNTGRPLPAYETDEIVGAKDKEGRWWMSKVLARFEYQKHAIYYVEFLGWGSKFNEFINDPFKIQKFNPRKHKYFRPAWAKKISDGMELPDDIQQEIANDADDDVAEKPVAEVIGNDVNAVVDIVGEDVVNAGGINIVDAKADVEDVQIPNVLPTLKPTILPTFG